jgi:hypothetical protein
MRGRLVIPVSIIFVFGLLGPPTANAAAPANDNLSGATAIASLPFSDVVSNTESSVEPGESQWCPYQYGNRTVWYSITPTADGVLQADLSGSSFYDHYIAVYQSPTPDFSQLTRLTCATYSDPVTFKAVAGTTYYIQAGDLWSGGGSLQLNVREVVPPANDDFENATSINGFPFSDSVDIANATLQLGEPAGCAYQTVKSVWYTLTPQTSGSVSMTASNLYDIELSAYRDTGAGLGGLLALACAYQSSLSFPVEAGVTYYILGRSAVSTSGTLVLNGSFILPPPNDDFADATAVGAVPFSDTTSNAATTTEPGEAVCPNSNHGTVWYSLVPSATGSFTARASGGGPVLGLYQGNNLASLTQIACSSNYYPALLTFHADAGSRYFVQVSASYYPVDTLFELFATPSPNADFFWGPQNANIFTTVYFYDTSTDPGGVGFAPAHWDFGDGATAEGRNASHQFAKDGDYTVTMTTTTLDGRTANTSKVVSIRTHDIGIAKLTVPTAASAGQTRAITVGVSNHRYPESGVVTLWKGAYPFNQVISQLEGVAIPVLPGGRTTNFTFTYTFTAQDAAVGKVTFGAAVGIWISGIPDAYPADNSVIATPTRVTR